MATAVIAVAAVVASAISRRATRGYLEQLAGRRDEALAARRAFDELVGGLQNGTDEERARFADDLDAVERHSLADLRERARRIAEDTNTMPLPKVLIPAAEAVADASDILAEEAEKAGEGTIGDESLEALASADLGRVARAFAYADDQVTAIGARFGMDEMSADGEGLYIR